MSLLGSIWTAYSAAREAQGAVEAAQAVLAAGGTVGAALDAFAAQTATLMDDTALAELRMAADQALAVAHAGVSLAVDVTGWLDQHRAHIRTGAITAARLARQLPTLVDQITDGASAAGKWLTVAGIRIEALR